MKLPLTNSLLFCLFLTGCAQNQIPYELVKSVDKSVDKEYRLSKSDFPLGVTQEKIGENKYYITAKLTKYSTLDRAKSMVFYHAAILAEEQGYNAFFTNRNSRSDVCISNSELIRNTRESRGGEMEVKEPIEYHRTYWIEHNPTASLTIMLMAPEKTSKNITSRRRYFLVKDIKKRYQPVLDQVASKGELEQIAKDNFALCEKTKHWVRRQNMPSN